MRDEALIKWLEAAIHTDEICAAALGVLLQRVGSAEISDNMLLRTVSSLGKIVPCFECVEHFMNSGPNTNAAECFETRSVNAVPPAIHSKDIWRKARDILCKRIDSGETSDTMLLHIVGSLSKSTACFQVHRRSRRLS